MAFGFVDLAHMSRKLSWSMASLVSNRPCNVADLLAAVFEITLEEAFAKCGLELCPVCGLANNKSWQHYPCCNESH